MSIALQDPALAGSPETLAPCHILQHFVVFFTVCFVLVVVQLSTCALKFFPAPILLTVPIELKREDPSVPKSVLQGFLQSPLCTCTSLLCLEPKPAATLLKPFNHCQFLPNFCLYFRAQRSRETEAMLFNTIMISSMKAGWIVGSWTKGERGCPLVLAQNPTLRRKGVDFLLLMAYLAIVVARHEVAAECATEATSARWNRDQNEIRCDQWMQVFYNIL